MGCREVKVKGSDYGESKRLQSQFDSGLSRFRKLLNAQAALTTVQNSKGKFVFEKAHFRTMLRHTADADSTKRFRRAVCHSHQSSTLPVRFALRDTSKSFACFCKPGNCRILTSATCKIGIQPFSPRQVFDTRREAEISLSVTSSSTKSSTTFFVFLFTSATTKYCKEI